MDAIKAIMTRRSTRAFLDRKISEEDIRKILGAAMSGPSAVNARPWSFIVVTDKDMLARIADGNGRAAEPLRKAALGIVVCGDMARTYERAPDYWTVDAAIATENMILAAHSLGIGSVWLGTWPQKEKVEAQKRLFGLPEGIVPHSVVAFGYPKSTELSERDLYEEDRVHFEKW